MSFKRMFLTDLVVPIPRAVGATALAKAIEKFGLAEKWVKTPWAKTQQQRTLRAKMTDFDRFKVMLAKKQVRLISLTRFIKL
jgi:large subunit ribosomal protein L14e